MSVTRGDSNNEILTRYRQDCVTQRWRSETIDMFGLLKKKIQLLCSLNKTRTRKFRLNLYDIYKFTVSLLKTEEAKLVFCHLYETP